MKHQRCDATGRSMKAYNNINSSCHESKQAADTCMNSSCQKPIRQQMSQSIACRELMMPSSYMYTVAEIQAVV